MDRSLRRTDARGRAHRAAPADLELLAWLLDNAIPIPGTTWRIGLDAVIGLVPGAGDVVSGLVGILIVGRGAQLGLPRVVLARMLANVALDFAIGAIPLIGDAFDAWYKAHARNVGLLRRHLATSRASTAGDWAFFAILLGAFVLSIAGLVWLIGAVLGTILG
ncbi:MAG TPA: DUF4112 domain-containing protein [candidate division Zixibacteria bacterium]|nr:DUF4112 domain-containing protein [candidate division Zixibacteria bacterium]